MITFSLETITPESASRYLEANKANRNIRQTRVDSYARDIQSGKFPATHQCVAFNANGDLIDGQHRLSAIVKANMPVQMYVARYDRTETAMMLPLDVGLSRCAYEVLKATKKDAETASCIIRLVAREQKYITAFEVNECLEKFGEEIRRVNAVVSVTVKKRTSAGARAAVALLIRKYAENADEILIQYKKFVALDIEGMWTSVAACARALENIGSNGGGSSAIDVAVRVWYAFTPSRKNVKLVRILSVNELLFEMQNVE